MEKKGIRTAFVDEGVRVIIKIDKKILSTGTLRRGLYFLNISNFSEKAFLASSIGLWQERLAHINISGIKSTVNSGTVRGIEIEV